MKVFYHANCTDGVGAAFAAYTELGDTAEYIPVQYGNPPPQFDKGEYIFIVDFSYKRDVLLSMAEKASHITIIDHHKTAQEDLKDIEEEASNITAVFDMNKSGAVLTWEFFFPEYVGVPELLLHIQDRDLWRFEMDGTKDICAGLQIRSEWKEWGIYLQSGALQSLQKQGESVSAYRKVQIEKIVQSPTMPWAFDAAYVPVFNLQGFMISDTLHRALEIHPEAPYAVAYFDIPHQEKRVYSLRSRQGTDVDVSDIAKTYGGGGHKHAAGFSVSLEKL